MTAKKKDEKKTPITKFFLGHDKPTRTDFIEMAIAAVFVVYLSFFVLKIHEII